MKYKLINYMGVFKYFKFIQSKRVFILLLILCTTTIIVDKYWLKPQLEEVVTQKASIVARKFAEMDELTVQETIEILSTLAMVNSDGLWVHSIKIEQNTINLTIRSFDAKIIEKYIYEVVERTHLKLENMSTKNVNYKEVIDAESEEQPKQVPFAVKLYLESLKNSDLNGEQSEDENDDYITKNKIFFAYEAQIKLLAHSY